MEKVLIKGSTRQVEFAAGQIPTTGTVAVPVPLYGRVGYNRTLYNTPSDTRRVRAFFADEDDKIFVGHVGRDGTGKDLRPVTYWISPMISVRFQLSIGSSIDQQVEAAIQEWRNSPATLAAVKAQEAMHEQHLARQREWDDRGRALEMLENQRRELFDSTVQAILADRKNDTHLHMLLSQPRKGPRLARTINEYIFRKAKNISMSRTAPLEVVGLAVQDYLNPTTLP